jgi:hypothetical protein
VDADTPPAVLAVTLVPRDGMNSTSYTESLLRMFAYDAARDGMLLRGGGPMLLPASPNTLPERRNNAAQFLLDQSTAEWLLFVDSDMGFDETALELLLAAADPVERPVVGALCFGMRQVESDQRGGWRTQPFPTLYDWRPNDSGKFGFVLRYDYSADCVTQVAATGAAFLLIHRDVLAKLRAQVGDTWFDRARMDVGEGLMGEDISFCARLGRIGVPVFVHTGVKTTHLKPVWVDEDFYLDQRALSALRAASVPEVADAAA